MLSLEKLDKDVYEYSLWYTGLRAFERELFIPTEANVEAVIEQLSQYRQMLKDITVEDEHDKIWCEQLDAVIDAFDVVVRENQNYPNRFIAALIDALNRLFTRDKRSYEERMEVAETKLTNAGDLIEALEDLSLGIPDRQIDETIRMERHLIKIIEEGMEIAKEMELKMLFDDVRERLKASVVMLEALKGEEREVRLGIPFREIVLKKWALDLDWIMNWYKEEEQKCLRDFADLAAKIDPTKPPLEILMEVDSPDFASPEHMIEEATKYLKRARENALKFISFPDGERLSDRPVRDIPERRRHELVWGASGGDAEGHGGMQLNLQNFHKISRGWIQMMAIHEVYPGHYLHSAKIRSKDMPHAFRLGGGMGTMFETRLGRWLSEGLAHRAESLFGDVFGEGILPLFAAYRRVHCSTRALLDIWLFQLDKSIEDCVRKYMENMAWDDEDSRIQVMVHLNRPGVRLGFYCGLMILQELQKKTTLSDREFNELCYSAGNVTPKVLEMLIKKAEREKNTYP